MEAILAPGRLFHPCPQGRFWYRGLDPLAGWTPDDGTAPTERWTTGIVPETRLDAAAFVRVLIAGPRDLDRRWHGDWLLTLEQPAILTDADWDATLAFLGTDRTLAFLDLARDRCRRQAAERRVHADLGEFGPHVDRNPGTRSRLLRAMIATDRLGARLDDPSHLADEGRRHRTRAALESILDAADAISDGTGPDRGLAHRVAAAAASHLGHLDDAADHVRAYAQAIPGDDDFIAAIERRMTRSGR
jgi:hypothetical protein